MSGKKEGRGVFYLVFFSFVVIAVIFSLNNTNKTTGFVISEQDISDLYSKLNISDLYLQLNNLRWQIGRIDGVLNNLKGGMLSEADLKDLAESMNTLRDLKLKIERIDGEVSSMKKDLESKDMGAVRDLKLKIERIDGEVSSMKKDLDTGLITYKTEIGRVRTDVGNILKSIANEITKTDELDCYQRGGPQRSANVWSIVACPSDYKVTGGGCSVIGGNVIASYMSGNGWGCVGTGKSTAYAACCKLS
ncbi:hypothetical protein HY498_05445 [Candidatus Woesearchaeota archaeon]|nr:hypothetical protein [Candidatus Woesearchaeota archaeon]